MDGDMLITSIEEKKAYRFTDEQIRELIERVTGMAILYGVQQTVTAREFPELVETLPLTLFPSPLPRQVYVESRRLHPHFQTLVYKIANNYDFLHACLKGILPGDEFTKGLWNIYDTVRREDPDQVSFMITRNDFMMEDDPDHPNELCIKHVEINTIAAGSGGYTAGVTETHRYSMSLTGTPFRPEQLPDNNSSPGLSKGLHKAWELYNKQKSIILFVVGIPERNTPDQRWLERDLNKINPHVDVVYRTFEQLLEQSRLTENKELFVGDREVAVVYYRHGYSPKHYPTPKEWELRLTIELSKAIKCPSAGIHLAGCKKVQQVMSNPGVLEQFLDDPAVIADMRKTFVGQVGLDQLNKHVVEKAKQNPERYVLKPQREGGGNNLFGEDLAGQIDKLYNSADAPSWILMDRIQAHCHRNRLLRVGLDSNLRNVVSEIGIHGLLIGTRSEVLMNFECGHLLKTKPEEAFEGGIFGGQSCMDSPFLIG